LQEPGQESNAPQGQVLGPGEDSADVYQPTYGKIIKKSS